MAEQTAHRQITIPAAATPAEAAAIVAAIDAHLATHRVDDTPDDTWDGKRWSFAGRLRENSRVVRSDQLPTDAWTAAGRVEQR